MTRNRRLTATLEERLRSRLVVMPSGCHEWQGSRSAWGHGRLNRGRRGEGNIAAHRAAWELANGPIPDGLFVCHHCDNPPCCNVEHLFLGTAKDNSHDMSVKGRAKNSKKTHCPKGHEYDDQNTRILPGGAGRRCRACHNLHNQQARALATRRRRESS